MNKVKNFLYVYTGLRSLTNAIKHWLGMTMLEAKFNRLHDEYADTIIAEVDDKSRDIQSDLEYELEAQLSDGIDEKYSNDISSAVEEYADDVLPSLVAKSIDNTDVFTDVEDLLNRVNDIEATQESSIEQETEAEVVVLKADFETLQDKVEALEKFIEVLVDKQSWFLDEVESSSDSLKRIALLTNLDVSNALKELKGEK
jgi:polyhydroxyalkanoate synthesis regulator phasin